MTEDEPKAKRSNPPLCTQCHHSRSFHSEAAGGRCKALGCTKCDGFQGEDT